MVAVHPLSPSGAPQAAPTAEAVASLIRAAAGIQPRAPGTPGWIDRKAAQVAALLAHAALTLGDAPRGRPLVVVDAACGHGYAGLAFAALLAPGLGLRTRVLGIERDTDRAAEARARARRAGVPDVEFVAADLACAPFPDEPDVVLGLHACGPAADALLAASVAARARRVLLVSCCHRKGAVALDRSGLPGGGLLGDRARQVVTDALRALRLEAAGYRVEPVELMPVHGTARNLLLRARATGGERRAAAAAAQLRRLEALFLPPGD